MKFPGLAMLLCDSGPSNRMINEEKNGLLQNPRGAHFFKRRTIVEAEQSSQNNSLPNTLSILKKKNLKSAIKVSNMIDEENQIATANSTNRLLYRQFRGESNEMVERPLQVRSEAVFMPAILATVRRDTTRTKSAVRREQIRNNIRNMKSATLNESGTKDSLLTFLEALYESKVFFIAFGFVIFLSLFIRDLWVICFSNKSSDVACDVLLFVILAFFVVESIANSIAFAKYRFSFVFFLDTISTLTLILDISTVFDIRASQGIRSGIFVRLPRLLTIFKLWRASRLYFRKNQIIEYRPITSETVDQVVQEHQKKHHAVGEVQLDQIIYYTQGSLEEYDEKQLATQGTRRLIKYPGIRTSFLVKSEVVSPEESANESAEHQSLQQGRPVSFKPGETPADLKSSQQNFTDDKLKLNLKLAPQVNGSMAMVELTSSFKESVSMAPSDKKILVGGSQASPTISAIKEHTRDGRRYLANSFVASKSYSKSIFNYRLKQSGNISKTLMYANVRNMACFLLLSNLGLSIFLSNMLVEEPRYCLVDRELVRIELESESADFVGLRDMLRAKYAQASTPLLRLEVQDRASYSDAATEQARRPSELVRCWDVVAPEGSSRRFEVTVTLDNRQYVVLDSMMNLLKNVVLILILVVNIVGVNRDTRTMIVDPMEVLFKYVGVSYQRPCSSAPTPS